MKNIKLTLLFSLLSFVGLAQTGTKLSLSQLQYAPGSSYVINSDLTGKATWTNTIPFSMITGTSSILFSTSSYSNPSWLSALAWSKITGTPTSISGYGITDPLIKGSLSSGYVPYATSSSSVTSSNIFHSSSGATIFNSTLDGEGSGNDNITYTTTTGGLRIGHYSQTGSGTTYDYYTNGVKNSSIFEGGGYMNVKVKNFWALYTLNDNTARFFMDGSTGYIGIGAGGFTPLERLHVDGNVRINSLSASKLVYTDVSNNLVSLPLGSGVAIVSGSLTATGTGSTTIVTGTNNITVTGSAPNYTVGVSTSPTFTNSTHAGTTTLTGVINHSMSASAASSSTVDLGTLTGNYAHITGTTTINNFGVVQAGAERCLVFDGSLTLTHSANLILQYGANIVTQANDVAVFRSEGSGVWRLTNYTETVATGTWTPSHTGYSTDPSGGNCVYILRGNVCTVWMQQTNLGISNATTCTFTLPFASKYSWSDVTNNYNNTGNSSGLIQIAANSNIVTAFATVAGGAWNSAGTNKRVTLCGFEYIINQ